MKSFICGSLEDGSDEGPGGHREHKPMARADNQACVGRDGSGVSEARARHKVSSKSSY